MRVLVNVLKVLLVDVRVRVRLSGVAVFMLVLNVLVIVQDVRVGVRHFPMRVLMRVLLHRFPVLRSIRPNVEFPAVICELMGGFINRCYTTLSGYRQVFPSRNLMRLPCN
ncbi:MAG TPA: hypothetical protein VK887_14865 [Pseudonocardiaceae bacterium]|nr:hypothetical protein [Pseudonocardiaceae bacterium]